MVKARKPAAGPQPENIVKGPDCNHSNVYHDSSRGEMICRNCGVVLSFDAIDPSQEWRAFTPEEDAKRNRTGSPRKPYETAASMSTLVGSRWENTDAAGRQLPPQKRSEIYRLRKWQIRDRVHNYEERNLNVAVPEIDRLCSQMRLPKLISEEAKGIYRMSLRRLKHRVRAKYIPASVYAAARMNDSPLILEDLIDNCGEVVPPSAIEKKLSKDYTYKNKGEKEKKEKREKEVRKQAINAVFAAYRHISTTLGLKPPLERPECYVPRFVSEIYKDKDSATRTGIEKGVLELIQEAREANIVQAKGPRGIAAAAIYIVGVLTGNHVTQRDVAYLTHLTEVTVRNRYREIVDTLGITAS